MQEELVFLYTNLSDAKNALGSLKDKGIRKAYLTTTEFGLHIGISQKQLIKKFPGAFPSTVVKVVAEVEPHNKENAVSILEEVLELKILKY
ncbi:hypothetical protein [Ruminiclostridium josui]|uniref:hypothetical protein n=1 Tax=Ruminiclostridium josui TaxID=1499 RepID=UPI000AA14E93|nr:hypothetical protein [Ruminiclostridium josui]